MRTDIAMGFDTRYTPHAAALIASIVRYAPGSAFRFIILHDGVPPGRRAQLESVAPGATFHWAEVGDEDVPQFEYGHLTRAILFRLGLEKLAPGDCERVLYIDADTIVLDDIRKLAACDLGDCAIAAVHDRYAVPTDFARRWSLESPAPRYFNSGVLLIDLARVRAERSFSAATTFIADNPGLAFADQDALNFIFWERWRTLDPRWNVQRYMNADELGAAGFSPALVHFIGLEKPWLPNIWHPWAWIYWDNLKRTPFAQEVARAYKMDLRQMMRLRLKWWLKRPRPSLA